MILIFVVESYQVKTKAMEMEQICEIVGKEYELKFSWTLKNMKSFDWVPSSYLESKRLEFKEINCSA